MESDQNRRVRRYFKCSKCKLIDSILLPPSVKHAKCAVCQSLFKEISESEFKEKKKKLNELIERTKQENNRQRDNRNRINNHRQNQNNIQNEERRNRDNRNRNRERNNEENNEHNRGNSLLHYSRMNINNMNEINDNINNNHINFNNINENNINNNRINNRNNNINRNQNNSNHNHNNNRVRRNNNQNNRRRRDQSSERHASNNFVEHIFGNLLRPISAHPMMIINQNRNRNPFRIVIQRQNVPNYIFDPFFINFGSAFNGAFQDNFSSNFRSNYRGDFVNEILRRLQQNQNDERRQHHHPTSNENLKKLKQFNMSEKYCKKEGEKLELPNCCICIDEIAIGQKTILLPCGHMFHNDCIVTWLKKNNTCPMCRFEIK